jgi:hypothetical protein
MQVQEDDPVDTQDYCQLLELPARAHHLILQQLDQCSLACIAVTCSTLSHTVPAHTSKLAGRCWGAETGNSFHTWIQRHSSSLIDIRQCSIAGVPGNRLKLQRLSGPLLRQLRLQYCDLQLGTARGCSGVLHDCTGLIALDLVHCMVQDAPAAAAAAAIAALPELQSLRLAHVPGLQGNLVLTLQISALQQLTHLSLDCQALPAQQVAGLMQLSGLVNLQHLQLTALPRDGVPGGLPSQLVKLTYLDIAYGDSITGCDIAEQFQNLDSFTALQQLSVASSNLVADDLSGLQDILQLTGLKLASPRLEFSSTSTASWACANLSELQSLELRECTVQPKALEALTQLQVLSLVDCQMRCPAKELLAAFSKLLLLTDLHFVPVKG